MKMASFEKLKSDLNQTWFIGIIWEPSLCSCGQKVTNQGQRSSEVNLFSSGLGTAKYFLRIEKLCNFSYLLIILIYFRNG